LAIRRSRGSSLAATGTLQLSDVSIDETEPDPAGRFGRGLELVGPGVATLRRLSIRGAGEGGVTCFGPASIVDAQDVRIEDVRGLDNGERGIGITAVGGCALRAEALVVESAHATGILAYGATTSLELDHLRVSDVRS